MRSESLSRESDSHSDASSSEMPEDSSNGGPPSEPPLFVRMLLVPVRWVRIVLLALWMSLCRAFSVIPGGSTPVRWLALFLMFGAGSVRPRPSFSRRVVRMRWYVLRVARQDLPCRVRAAWCTRVVASTSGNAIAALRPPPALIHARDREASLVWTLCIHVQMLRGPSGASNAQPAEVAYSQFVMLANKGCVRSAMVDDTSNMLHFAVDEAKLQAKIAPKRWYQRSAVQPAKAEAQKGKASQTKQPNLRQLCTKMIDKDTSFVQVRFQHAHMKPLHHIESARKHLHMQTFHHIDSARMQFVWQWC